VRRLKQSWIKEYLEYISGFTESPTKYHEWCALTGISAVLKRHVWVDRIGFKIYPNLYTVLVGRPGIGKGAAISPMIRMLRETKVVHTLSDRITMEYVLEKLSIGFPIITSTGLPVPPGLQQAVAQVAAQKNIKLSTEACALIIAKELSVFITASQFSITALTDLWDNEEGTYGYGTRGKGERNINSPCVCLLGGSAQEWLVKSIPADAVGGGFTRRVNFVFATKKDKKIAWPVQNGFKNYDNFIDDLKEISNLRGEFTLTKGARQLFEPYYDSCEPAEFDDEATSVYKTSKWANALKLAMIISAARGDSMQIDVNDWIYAVEKIEEVAKDLKVVFRAVGESDVTVAADRVIRYLELKGYATRSQILHANWRHISSEDLDKVIMTLREGGIIGEKTTGSKTLYELRANLNP
jgi:hypothetical protein